MVVRQDMNTKNRKKRTHKTKHKESMLNDVTSSISGPLQWRNTGDTCIHVQLLALSCSSYNVRYIALISTNDTMGC